MPDETRTIESRRAWRAGEYTRVPYWVFRDPQVLALECARIFRGPTWNFLCLEAELPAPGDFKTTMIGDMPVIVVRASESTINAFENRCAHRGALLALANRGNARDFTCVYHAWRHDLEGNLCGIAFQHGVKGQGGMPADFRMDGHGPRKLRVATVAGLVFGTLDQSTPPIEQYLGSEIDARIRRVLRRPLVPLGTFTQVMHNNWKLYFENARDSYHSSILHLFFTKFNVVRMSHPGGILVDASGGHHASFTYGPPPGKDDAYEQTSLRANPKDGFTLADPSILDYTAEQADGGNAQILTVFPNLVVQQIQNSLAVRQVVPRAVDRTDLVWTYFGYDDDTEALRRLRLKHANFVGPAGYISMEDGAVGGFVQRGIAACENEASIIQMGGTGTETQPFRATEVSVRGFWKAYRNTTGL